MRGVFRFVLVVAIVSGLASCSSSKHHAAAPNQQAPPAFAAPSPAVAAATRTYLDGQGRTLSSMHTQVKALIAHPDASTCATVGRALGALGSPTQLRVVAASSPDHVLADITADETTSLHSVLGTCAHGGAPTGVNTLQSIDGTVGERLSQLGVAK